MKPIKWIRLVTITIVILFCFSKCFYTKKDHDINHYLKSGNWIDVYASEVLPDITKLPEYKSIYYQYFLDHDFIFRSETMLLVVSYNKETYVAEKEKLNEVYSFLDHTVSIEYDPEYYLIPEYKFSINSFDFRVIDDKGKEYIYYPHGFGIIATSDKKCCIAYMYFYDFDLDYISSPNNYQSMKKFIKGNFPYKW